MFTIQVKVSYRSFFKYSLIGSETLEIRAVLGSTYLNISIVLRYITRIFSVVY